jgi:hypothetical protein
VWQGAGAHIGWPLQIPPELEFRGIPARS